MAQQALKPNENLPAQVDSAPTRDVVFISKATPGNDEFALWLAPRLEAEGYKVFADILSIHLGDRWRKEITGTLQNKAIKMLLCCTDETLAKDGVQEEIGIAEDLVKELSDSRFIMPLKLKKYKKVFGTGELQYVDFENGWAQGLAKLLDELKNQGVPKAAVAKISPEWERYKSRLSLGVEDRSEALTSNWLRITELPDTIRYYEPAGASDLGALQRTCREYAFPTAPYNRGFFAFSSPEEIAEAFSHLGRFDIRIDKPTIEFFENGAVESNIYSREASNLVSSIIRQAWESFCREKGLTEFPYSKQLGFHAGDKVINIGKKLPWGRQGASRSSMLRNIAKGKVWNYGASAIISLWPYPHLRLKARVLFAALDQDKAGPIIDDVDQQFRLRRKVCKSWRNKQWMGRMMAFLELLSGDSASIVLPTSPSSRICIEASPNLFTSPVTTKLPDVLQDDDEELDESTFGNRDLDSEESE